MLCTSCAATRSTTPAAAMASASWRSASRLVISDIALPHFFREILSRTPRERDDRMGGILVGVGDERRPICDEQILHVVRLTEFVERTRARVVAHPDRAHF